MLRFRTILLWHLVPAIVSRSGARLIDRREKRLHEVERTFELWHNLDTECKQRLYARDHRWHDRAMRLEQDDAERFCREGESENIAYDTYPADMKADLSDVIHRSGSDCAIRS